MYHRILCDRAGEIPLRLCDSISSFQRNRSASSLLQIRQVNWIERLIELLSYGYRLAVINFHSLHFALLIIAWKTFSRSIITLSPKENRNSCRSDLTHVRPSIPFTDYLSRSATGTFHVESACEPIFVNNPRRIEKPDGSSRRKEIPPRKKKDIPRGKTDIALQSEPRSSGQYELPRSSFDQDSLVGRVNVAHL